MAQINTYEHLRRLIPEPPSAKGAAKIYDHLCVQAMPFIRACPLVLLATRGSWGLEISPKGDGAGFIEVVDQNTILIPERKGNRMALGLQNMMADPQIGMMFIKPNTNEVLRCSGKAELLDDRDLCERLSARGEPAILVIKVTIERSAFHCPRSLKRAGAWAPETWEEPVPVSIAKAITDALNMPEQCAALDAIVREHDKEL